MRKQKPTKEKIQAPARGRAKASPRRTGKRMTEAEPAVSSTEAEDAKEAMRIAVSKLLGSGVFASGYPVKPDADDMKTSASLRILSNFVQAIALCQAGIPAYLQDPRARIVIEMHLGEGSDPKLALAVRPDLLLPVLQAEHDMHLELVMPSLAGRQKTVGRA